MIHVDQSVGAAIAMFLRETQKERPLTHDLIAHVLHALGARIERVIVNDLKRGTYFARLILSAENELHQRKTIEIDARPSDCIAMATQHSAPVYVTGEVWEEVEEWPRFCARFKTRAPSPASRTRTISRVTSSISGRILTLDLIQQLTLFLLPIGRESGWRLSKQ